ncbi:MAG: O-succinylhomoserine sulfhydrylase [Bacteroidia bacterium]|nr:O-succinylhomoserine sulfhydrylase [Bacteroidia bacterium]
MAKSKHFETLAVRTQTERTAQKEHSTPLFLTSSFMFDDAEDMRALFADEKEGNIYSRFTNPNNSELIEKMNLLEGTEAGLTTATGMAAVFTTFAALLNAGDHLLSCRSIFGSTHSVITKLLPKWNIAHSYVDINAPDTWQAAVKKESKLLYVETPSNPGIDIIDLEWLGKFAKQNNLILVVDNCFATPYLQQPVKFGADIIIHSATKYLDGQGRVMGGTINGSKKYIDTIKLFARHTGPALSPFNAWIISKSLETLAVRMDKHSDNALKLAQWLEQSKEIELVKYPFLPSHPQHEIAKKQMSAGGGIVTFIVKGGVARGRKFMDALQMLSISANLGDTRSIVTHPASSTHAKLTEAERLESGILPGLVRISVGLEHVNDIIADVEQALNASK